MRPHGCSLQHAARCYDPHDGAFLQIARAWIHPMTSAGTVARSCRAEGFFILRTVDSPMAVPGNSISRYSRGNTPNASGNTACCDDRAALAARRGSEQLSLG